VKGIILAGGTGTRLYPATRAVSKQLVPVYNKPMVYYPLSTLMLAGIRQILVITTPEHQEGFLHLLGDGRQIGLDISYECQPKPEGIAQALIIGREFVGRHTVALALGDNIFYGDRLSGVLTRASSLESGATIFGYAVRDGKPVSLEEKPARPRSRYAITGLYFYDNDVFDIAAGLRPSPRGELEITDVNRMYMERGDLRVEVFGRGFAWLDTGTYESLLQASLFVQSIEDRQGLMLACLEEIAWRLQYISTEQVVALAEPMRKNAYGQYLLRVVEQAEVL
jgi:glucose-1-phosphate thymidylyltransferase